MSNTVRWVCQCGHIAYESVADSSGGVLCEFCNIPMRSETAPVPIESKAPIPVEPIPVKPIPVKPVQNLPPVVQHSQESPMSFGHNAPFATGPAPEHTQIRAPMHPPASAPKSSGCLLSLIIGAIFIGVIVFAVFQVKRGIDQAINQVAGWVNMIDGVKQLGNVDELIEEYENKGYQKTMSQISRVSEPINEKRLYIAQAITIDTDVHEDIAFLGQVVSIRGTVDGNVDFMGQMLEIEKSAVIKGDVNVKLGQMVRVQGLIEGKLTGAYQALDAAPEKIVGGTMKAKELWQTAQKNFNNLSKKSKRPSSVTQQEVETLDAPTRAQVEIILGRNGYSETNRAYRKLKASPPQDKQARITLGKILLAKMDDNANRSEIIEVFDKVVMPQHADEMAKLLKSDANRYRKLMDPLTRLDRPQSMIGLINLNDSEVSRRAWEATRKNETLHNELATQCLADIQTRSIIRVSDRLAGEHLLELNVTDQALQTKILKHLVTEHTFGLSNKYQIISKLLSEQNVEELFPYARKIGGDPELTKIIGKIKSGPVYKFMVQTFFENRGSYFEAPISETPDCESHIWPFLKARSSRDRRNAIKFLEKIGTAASIPHLEPMLDDLGHKYDVNSALKKIKERSTPADAIE